MVRVCDKMTSELDRKKPPFQSERYEYAELVGARVIEKNIYDRKLNGTLSTCGDEFLIVINEEDSPERKSFTVCHELGHMKMLIEAESELGRDRVLNRFHGSLEEERLSDMFAVNLLMPRKEFKKEATALDPSMKSLLKLASTFRTSVEAAARRVVRMDIWPCALLWCMPVKQQDGGYVVKITNIENSASLKPPVSFKGYVRWGVDAVCEAYNNKKLSCSQVTFHHPGRNSVERWNIECLNRGGERCELVLALMFRR